VLLFFFFQAEDGIRDLIVTGVQTCALPILRGGSHLVLHARDDEALARLDLPRDAHIVGLQDRGGRHAVTARDRLDGFALRDDDGGAAIPAPARSGRLARRDRLRGRDRAGIVMPWRRRRSGRRRIV